MIGIRNATGFSAAIVFALGVLAAPGDAGSRPSSSSIDFGLGNTTTGKPGVFQRIQDPELERAMADAVLTHDRNLRRLPGLAAAGAAPDAISTDLDVDRDGVLDIAVVADNGRIILPARADNFLDLQPGMRIGYTPAGANTFSVALTLGQTLDPVLGADLGLGDDAFVEVALTFAFPFLGGTHDAIFVGSDGHVTLDVGDGSSSTRDAARHIGGPPRFSALLTDLDPTCRGKVHADVRTDRVVVTWNDVVHFQRGAASGCVGVPGNTFQTVLHADGSIDYVFGALDSGLISQPGGNQEAVTGIAGGNSEPPINEIDMTADLPAELQAGAIFEQFSPGAAETFDTIQMAQEFYRTHEDKYDYLVMFTDSAIFGGGTAFHLAVQNQTLGLGRATSNNSALFGSAGELESFVWMNNINLWAGADADRYTNPPIHRFAVTTSPRLTAFLGGNVTPTTAPYEQVGMLDITGNGNRNGYTHHGRALIHENPHTEARAQRGTQRYDLNSAISIMFQEADHRWAAFSAFVHPTKGIVVPDSFDLLGRGQAHWSTFFNTRVVGSPFTALDGQPRFSGMEGNALIELDIVGGEVVDKNLPGRVIADPDGRLTDGFAVCAGVGKGLYLTEPEELIDGANELDQYLMGVRRADEVGGFWYVDDPSSAIDRRSLDEPFPTDFIRGSTFNVDDIAFCGTRVDLTVSDITDLGTLLNIPARGPRVPAIGDENDIGPVDACLAIPDPAAGRCVDVKTMAWILLVNGKAPSASSVRRLNQFRLAWQAYVDGPGLGGRNADGVERPADDPSFISKFDTSLEPSIH